AGTRHRGGRRALLGPLCAGWRVGSARAQRGDGPRPEDRDRHQARGESGPAATALDRSGRRPAPGRRAGCGQTPGWTGLGVDPPDDRAHTVPVDGPQGLVQGTGVLEALAWILAKAALDDLPEVGGQVLREHLVGDDA